MDPSISPIGAGLPAYTPPMTPSAGAGLDGSAALDGLAKGALSARIDSTSISASSESLMAAWSPMLSSNEAIGAALLLLILQYMQTQDPQERKDLLGLIGSLAAGQQSSEGSSGVLMYSSSQLSIETTSITLTTGGSGYDAGAQIAPPADSPGSAGLDVVA